MAPGLSGSDNPDAPSYPDEWRSSLAEAKRGVRFPVLLPDHARANEGNLTHIFVRPDDEAVMLDFPPPSSDTDIAIRQRYIEVYLSPWTYGDPETRFRESIEANPTAGRRMEYMDGRAVLIQEARSPDDIEVANPALIRFVMNGLDIQVSGGTDVELLKEIARTLS